MSSIVQQEMLPKMRWRYAKRGKKGKTSLINELCEQWGYERKYATKLLKGTFLKKRKSQKKRGRPARYGKEVIEVLLCLCKASDWPCGKRLAVIKMLWLPYYEGAYGKLAREIKEQLESISAAQIDRLLAPYKVKRGKSWTKPGSILKTQIPIRTDNWDVTQPGFLEADTVAHCGGSLEDGFIWSVTFTDIFISPISKEDLTKPEKIEEAVKLLEARMLQRRREPDHGERVEKIRRWLTEAQKCSLIVENKDGKLDEAIREVREILQKAKIS